MVKVLMVCYGNICRSPLAHGILESKVDPNLVFVDSAGTSNYHVGSKPDYRSIEVARLHNIDISKQRCRQLKMSDFREFDYIYVMDKSNYEYAALIAPSKEHMKKVKLILMELRDEFDLEVRDPYYGDLRTFEKVFLELDEACEVIAKKLENDLEINFV